MNLPDEFEMFFGKAKRAGGDELCPRCHAPAIGVEIPTIWDGVCYWRCETCRVKWHRFGTDEPHRRAAVERYWEGRL